jgi:hypothetical protein
MAQLGSNTDAIAQSAAGYQKHGTGLREESIPAWPWSGKEGALSIAFRRTWDLIWKATVT